MNSKTVVLAAALALTGAAAHAQNFLNMDINALNTRLANQQGGRMNQTTNGIVQANVANPQIVAAWRANPRGMSLQQYAYMYGATGGFTPRGIAQYNQTSANIAANERASVMGLRAAEANFGAAINDRNAAASANLQEAGRGLMGQATYYNPATGGYVPLSYMPSAGPVSQGGWTYRPVGNGRYVASNGSRSVLVEQAPYPPR